MPTSVGSCSTSGYTPRVSHDPATAGPKRASTPSSLRAYRWFRALTGPHAAIEDRDWICGLPSVLDATDRLKDMK